MQFSKTFWLKYNRESGENMHSKEDVLDREPFVKQILDLNMVLSEKRKNCCFAIEGEWGSGKSFILEKIQERLQMEQAETTGTDRFFVVRYDCWNYDYYEEPIIAIISVLRERIEQYVSLLSNETKREMLAVVKNAITKIAIEAIKTKTGVDLEGVDQIPEDNAKIYDRYFGFYNVVKGVQKQIRKIAEDQTVVIIVDELDRCLPLYAIKVLERIHHVFNEVENVVVIIAMEKKQIENSLHQIYGDRMDVDRYLKKIISFSFRLDNGYAKNYCEKYASCMDLYNIQQKDELESFLKEITSGMDIRTQEKIFEKAENIHRLMATQEKMDSAILAFEILVLCIKEKMAIINMKWVIDMAQYPNIQTEVGKDYFDTIRGYVIRIRGRHEYRNDKFVCNEKDFIDRMVFIIAGLYNEYDDGGCGLFYCSDSEMEQKLNFSKKIYELLRM